jgi:hypothetical protein
MGNADPILVAAALHAIDGELDSLFPDDWQIVTNDAAVQRKAAKSGSHSQVRRVPAHPE